MLLSSDRKHPMLDVKDAPLLGIKSLTYEHIHKKHHFRLGCSSVTALAKMHKVSHCISGITHKPKKKKENSVASVGHSQVIYAALPLTSAKHKTKLSLKTGRLLVYPNILQGSDI